MHDRTQELELFVHEHRKRMWWRRHRNLTRSPERRAPPRPLNVPPRAPAYERCRLSCAADRARLGGRISTADDDRVALEGLMAFTIEM